MANHPKHKALTSHSLATFFFQLAQMEAAGIPAVTAITLVNKKESDLNKRLVTMLRFLTAGTSIADAGYKVGIFNITHKAIISAAESSGTLAPTYKQLASYYETKSNRSKKIKSRLYLPALTLLLALFIKPIPLLVNSEISLLSYLSLSLGNFFLILILLTIAYKIPSWFESLFHQVQLQISLVKNWVVRREVNEFLMLLSMMLEAGLTFEKAFPLAANTLRNTVLKKHFNSVVKTNLSGDSVTNILSKIDGISPTAIQIINTGELSGTLAKSILNFTRHEAETIHLQDDLLAEWVPRIFYASVAAWMTMSLFS